MAVTTGTVYMGCLIFVGLTGNVYCIFHLRTSNLRRHPLSCYLLALALSDSGFLLALSVSFFDTVITNGKIGNFPVVCQFAYYLSYLCCFLSGWYVAAISAERCLAVCKPFSTFTTLSRRRSLICLITVTLCGMLLNSWPLFAFESVAERNVSESEYSSTNQSERRYECKMSEWATNYYESFTVFDSVISLALPMIFIVFLNALIVRRILLSRKYRSDLVSNCSAPVRTRKRSKVIKVKSGTPNHRHSSKEGKVSLLLLAIAASYILFNTPNSLYRLINAFLIPPLESEITNEPTESWLDSFFILTFYTQFSINFVIYTFRGRTCCMGRRRNKTANFV